MYANYMAGLFLDDNESDDVLEPGLYAAVDPWASVEYGNTLLKIDVPEGTKFLDIEYEGTTFRVSHATIERLNAAGCDFMDGYKPPTPSPKRFRNAGRKRFNPDVCDDIFNDALEGLGVKMIGYDYSSKLPPFCQAPDPNDQRAFVIFDIPLNQESVSVFGGNMDRIKDTKGKTREGYMDLKVLRDGYSSVERARQRACEQWGSRIVGCRCKKAYKEDILH